MAEHFAKKKGTTTANNTTAITAATTTTTATSTIQKVKWKIQEMKIKQWTFNVERIVYLFVRNKVYKPFYIDYIQYCDRLMQCCNWDDDARMLRMKLKTQLTKKIQINKPIKCLIKQGIPNAMFVSIKEDDVKGTQKWRILWMRKYLLFLEMKKNWR